ncbi:MAG TPA: NAD-dependent epimerase/dehydratase family protein [Stellaceae bacterium]|nr:NAD-dependent epimerase/dehydratase family protein [Stellaceae bacterium]
MPDERPVLVLGAGGFLGRALVARLVADGVPVISAVRSATALIAGIETRVTGTLHAGTDWPALLHGCRAVVHLASRAHAAAGPGEEWIAAEEATAAMLAGAARREGVERLVLLSSLKVHGDASGPGRFRASDPPAPADAYGRAKLRIEAAMRHAAGAMLVVLRPPLVYGPGVKANFLTLLRAVDRGIPLPLGGIANRRSLVFLDNLVDLACVALTHERTPGGTFLMRDDEEVSTPGLVTMLARELGRPARLVPCPSWALRTAARLAGRAAAADRLLGSLSVDDAATRAALGWQPRVPLHHGIAATCRWYRARTSA